MAGIQHLSMRVPWRDRPWGQFLCDDPLGNAWMDIAATALGVTPSTSGAAGAGAAEAPARGLAKKAVAKRPRTD